MQVTASIGAQADNIAGVGWYFRLVEYNIKHRNNENCYQVL